MKRVLLLGVFIAGSVVPAHATSSCDSCDNEFSSRSFVFFEPRFHSASPEVVSGFRRREFAREDGYNSALQVALFGGKTTNSSDLATYMMPFGKQVITVSEQASDAPDDLLPDLFAQHFNIKTVGGTFLSQISMSPVQSVIGFGIDYRVSFWHNDDKGRGFWFELIAPVSHVKNSINFEERVLDDGGGVAPDAGGMVFQANMTQAMDQESWEYGKIAGSHSKTSLADVELKLGYEWLDHDPCHLESYIGVLVPFGNSPQGEYLFEPVVGFGKHFGILFGSAVGVKIWENEECGHTIRIEQNMHSQYLFNRTHVRSFDLKYRPWSRYMEVYDDQQQAQQAATIGSPVLATPGINVFTRDVDVTPGYSINTNSAFLFESKKWHAEAGYNFFAKQSECIKLACPWPDNAIALKHTDGDGQTTTVRDITGNFFLTDVGDTHNTAISLADYDQATLCCGELDLNSGSAPAQLSYSVYGSFGRQWETLHKKCDYPAFVDFGGSYMFSHNSNGTPRRWTIWGKAGLSF